MSGKIYEYNADELVQEMNSIMRKGISNILSDFMHRYDLLEKTHEQIMRLPSVMNHLNLTESESQPITKQESEPVKQIDLSIVHLNNKINLLEQKLDTFVLAFDTIIDKIQLKSSDSNEIQSSIFTTCKNENIKVEFKEVENKNENEKEVFNLELEEESEEDDETDEEETDEEDEVEDEVEEEVDDSESSIDSVE
jgi:hypothetical protein